MQLRPAIIHFVWPLKLLTILANRTATFRSGRKRSKQIRGPNADHEELQCSSGAILERVSFNCSSAVKAALLVSFGSDCAGSSRNTTSNINETRILIITASVTESQMVASEVSKVLERKSQPSASPGPKLGDWIRMSTLWLSPSSVSSA